MNTTLLTNPLTPTHIAQYKTEGYTIAPHFFTPEEVRMMQREVSRLQEAGLLRNVATDGDGQTTATAQANLQICPLSPKSEIFRSLPFSAKVRGAVESLLETGFLLQLDQIFLKPGRHGAGTNWHQDNAYFGCPDPWQGVGMWVAVHDATVANGTMHIVPRTHETALKHERDLTSDHHITCKIDEETAEILPIEMKAGGVLFFNYGIAHCTKGNQTDFARAGLALHFVAEAFADQTRARGPVRPVLAGPDCTGGVEEYGVDLTEEWDRFVRESEATLLEE